MAAAAQIDVQVSSAVTIQQQKPPQLSFVASNGISATGYASNPLGAYVVPVMSFQEAQAIMQGEQKQQGAPPAGPQRDEKTLVGAILALNLKPRYTACEPVEASIAGQNNGGTIKWTLTSSNAELTEDAKKELEKGADGKRPNMRFKDLKSGTYVMSVTVTTRTAGVLSANRTFEKLSGNVLTASAFVPFTEKTVALDGTRVVLDGRPQYPKKCPGVGGFSEQNLTESYKVTWRRDASSAAFAANSPCKEDTWERNKWDVTDCLAPGATYVFVFKVEVKGSAEVDEKRVTLTVIAGKPSAVIAGGSSRTVGVASDVAVEMRAPDESATYAWACKGADGTTACPEKLLTALAGAKAKVSIPKNTLTEANAGSWVLTVTVTKNGQSASSAQTLVYVAGEVPNLEIKANLPLYARPAAAFGLNFGVGGVKKEDAYTFAWTVFVTETSAVLSVDGMKDDDYTKPGLRFPPNAFRTQAENGQAITVQVVVNGKWTLQQAASFVKPPTCSSSPCCTYSGEDKLYASVSQITVACSGWSSDNELGYEARLLKPSITDAELSNALVVLNRDSSRPLAPPLPNPSITFRLPPTGSTTAATYRVLVGVVDLFGSRSYEIVSIANVEQPSVAEKASEPNAFFDETRGALNAFVKNPTGDVDTVWSQISQLSAATTTANATSKRMRRILSLSSSGRRLLQSTAQSNAQTMLAAAKAALDASTATSTTLLSASDSFLTATQSVAVSGVNVNLLDVSPATTLLDAIVTGVTKLADASEQATVCSSSLPNQLVIGAGFVLGDLDRSSSAISFEILSSEFSAGTTSYASLSPQTAVYAKLTALANWLSSTCLTADAAASAYPATESNLLSSVRSLLYMEVRRVTTAATGLGTATDYTLPPAAITFTPASSCPRVVVKLPAALASATTETTVTVVHLHTCNARFYGKATGSAFVSGAWSLSPVVGVSLRKTDGTEIAVNSVSTNVTLAMAPAAAAVTGMHSSRDGAAVFAVDGLSGAASDASATGTAGHLTDFAFTSATSTQSSSQQAGTTTGTGTTTNTTTTPKNAAGALGAGFLPTFFAAALALAMLAL
eukprot:tig00021572_g22411.t1